MLVSQPLAGLPSQSAKPRLHVGTHAPETHAVAPLALVQLVVQLPHRETESSGVSHPLDALPSQLSKPVAHTGVQVPATHEVVPCRFAHATPHAPQLPVLVCVPVSHPLAGSASQSPEPALHEGVQTPETQAVLPLAFVHALPQTPQSNVVFNEVSQPVATLASQLLNPGLHVIAQAPATHDGVPLVLLQAVAHAPQ